tara:strand:- start:179 stop:1060 length:882 start_codon:yes stop_codon:yes gene_type:complete
LYKSIEPFLRPNNKFVLICVDKESYDFLKNIKKNKLEIIFSERFESSEILEIKNKRKIDEYCWTLKPVAMDFLFKYFKGCEWIVYMDSDIIVFESINDFLDNSSDVILTPHRPSNAYFLNEINKAGIFNAGFVAFRNSSNGLNALKWWKKKCLNKCSNVASKDDYADQKYLNNLSSLFKNVNTNPDKSLNIAPWNIVDKSGYLNLKKKKVIFFHLQAFKIYNINFFDAYNGNFKISKNTLKHIYYPYIKILKKSYVELKSFNCLFEQKKEFKINLIQIIKRILKNKNNYLWVK